MKISTKYAGILLLTGIFGCATPHDDEAHYRAPTKSEYDLALSLSLPYARDHLDLSHEQFNKMKPDVGMVIQKKGETHLMIQFYDPEIFPETEWLYNDGLFKGGCGGFPSYFTITVDLISQVVVKAYATIE